MKKNNLLQCLSYLVTSRGLSLENAIKSSKKVHFETPVRPDSVLRLLKRHGFTDSNIAQFTRIRPELLLLVLSNPEKIFMPNLSFFRSITFRKLYSLTVISSNPCILSSSLDNHIIPFYEGMRSILGDDEKVVVALNYHPRILPHNFERKIAPNISVLREHRVPASSFSFLLNQHAILLLQRRDKFQKYVKEVIEMGFNSSALVFVIALNAIWTMPESKWKRKKEVLIRLGWSDAEFRSAFRSFPTLMYVSETKITSVMEFLVNEMGLKSNVIARNPALLSLSLQKRIIPISKVFSFLNPAFEKLDRKN